MLTDLPIELIIEILFICDYRSILRMNCICKLINNIDLESLLINKSKRVINQVHYIPQPIIFHNGDVTVYDDLIISFLKYLFDNDVNLAYNDKILPNKCEPYADGCISFSGINKIIKTSSGITVKPTYNIFEKFLKFHFR
jgi:hypothetical protein